MTMQAATDLFEALKSANAKVVFAESCTGGMVAFEMTKLPGVSTVFCGSAVTYREDTKQRWLGVDGETMQSLSAVSAPVAHQMASGVLSQTPEATLAVAITGHLGPQAPQGLDGCVFVAVAKIVKGKTVAKVTQHQLETTTRSKRRFEATALVLSTAIEAIG
jgi:nicotinamide-nucleotide amidase